MTNNILAVRMYLRRHPRQFLKKTACINASAKLNPSKSAPSSPRTSSQHPRTFPSSQDFSRFHSRAGWQPCQSSPRILLSLFLRYIKSWDNRGIKGPTSHHNSTINKRLSLPNTEHSLCERGRYRSLIWLLIHQGSVYSRRGYCMVDLHFCSLKIHKYLFQVWLIRLPGMTSTCVFKDTLRNDTEVFLFFKVSIFQLVYNLSTSLHTHKYLTSIILSLTPGYTNVI